MTSYNEFLRRVKDTYDETKDVGETAKKLKCTRAEVLEALGFSDEWNAYFDDE
jgi:hypothetical protein